MSNLNKKTVEIMLAQLFFSTFDKSPEKIIVLGSLFEIAEDILEKLSKKILFIKNNNGKRVKMDENEFVKQMYFFLDLCYIGGCSLKDVKKFSKGYNQILLKNVVESANRIGIVLRRKNKEISETKKMLDFVTKRVFSNNNF